MCGCVSTLDDGRGASATTGAGGASSSTSSTTGNTSQATGGAGGASATTGGGGSACRFACVDGGGGSPVPPPPDIPDAARDAAANDASGDTSAPGVGCTPDLRLCDDFESYADGMVPGGKWQTPKAPSSGASIVVDSTKAYSGTKAIHV